MDERPPDLASTDFRLVVTRSYTGAVVGQILAVILGGMLAADGVVALIFGVLLY